MTTIFLDRDGVINENRADYVKSWSEFRFLPGSLEAIARLTEARHRVVVCTNQAGVARGTMSQEAVEEIHSRMLARVAEFGGLIEKVYYCPHGKDENCACRKPRPGLLLQARDDLALDMRQAVFVGDCITDALAAQAAGICPILVLTGLGAEQLRTRRHDFSGPLLVRRNLLDVVNAIAQGLYLSITEQEEALCNPLLL